MARGLAGVAVLAIAAFGIAAAHAQSADPVADNYRAYQAAIARDDKAGAEAAAAAALAASEARDHDGGSTATLAANLAQVRLDLNRPADALAPAQRASQIAQSRGAAAGVNPTYAKLLVGEAELAQDGDAGQRDILAALDAAQNQPDIAPEAFDGAVRLGEWALRNDRGLVAQNAFDRALQFHLGDTDLDNSLRARAYLGQGIALVVNERGATARARTGTRMAVAPDQRPTEAFLQAMHLSKPIAERESRGGRMTRSQVTYGTALAWALARGARLSAMEWIDRTEGSDRRGTVVSASGEVLSCAAGLSPDPVPAYSAEAIRASGANAVVVRAIVDSNGAVTDRRLVGATGDATFVSAVNTVLPRWNVARGEGACAGARVVFAPVLIMAQDEMVAQTFRSNHGASARTTASLNPQTSMVGAPASGWVTSQGAGLIAVTPD